MCVFVVPPLLTGAREEEVMPEDRERQNQNEEDIIGRADEPDADDAEEFEDVEEDDEEDLES